MAILTDHVYKSVYCGHCGYEIRVPVHCHNRFCPLCSKSRAWRIRDRMTNMLKKVTLHQNENFRLLTLTIKSQSALKPMCRQMLSSFKKLRNRKFWKPEFPGGCFVLEITGKDGYWHAHLHILLQGRYVPQSIILNHWRQINGSGGVYIKTCNKMGVIYYLTKYLTKEPHINDDNEIISDVLRDFRLFQPFGTWHNLIPPFKKKSWPCPDCKSIIWIPSHVIEAEIRGSFRYVSRDKALAKRAIKRLNAQGFHSKLS